MRHLLLPISLLVVLAMNASPARAQDLVVAPTATRAPMRPRPSHRGAPTRAMRVWILRGEGPDARSESLGALDFETTGDCDAAIDLLQRRAAALHASAVIHVRIAHEPGGRVRISGLAIRYA